MNNQLRSKFPILSTKMNGNPLVYLDSAATTQKPQQVIDRIATYYEKENSNIHRGVYRLSQEATSAYEHARKNIASFINARSEKEIVFTSGATEAINLVASSFGKANLKKGDQILITQMEHHANIVPWQQIALETGAEVISIPITKSGELDVSNLDNLLTDKVKIISVVHISNSLGTINPVKEIIEAAHAKDIPVLVDGCQAVQHMKVDMQELDADFYVFSGHKMYGPTGIGVLYGKEELLNALPPYQTGGDMIQSVTLEKTTFKQSPERFEAGTPNIAGAIGLSAAVDFLNEIGLDEIAKHEQELLEYATEKMNQVEGLTIIGQAKEKAAVTSFILKDIHPHDLGTVLDQDGICLRTGQHCTQPIMDEYGISATSRISFGAYTTKEDIDAFIKSLEKTKKILL